MGFEVAWCKTVYGLKPEGKNVDASDLIAGGKREIFWSYFYYDVAKNRGMIFGQGLGNKVGRTVHGDNDRFGIFGGKNRLPRHFQAILNITCGKEDN